MSKIIANQLSPRSGDTVTINGNISVGGTVTYQDVTNVDSVGLITARTGVRVTSGGINVTAGGINVTAGGIDVTAGGIDVTDGGANITGIVTATEFDGQTELRTWLFG